MSYRDSNAELEDARLMEERGKAYWAKTSPRTQETFMATIEERLANNWTNGLDVRHLLNRHADLLRENAGLKARHSELKNAANTIAALAMGDGALLNQVTANNARLREALEKLIKDPQVDFWLVDHLTTLLSETSTQFPRSDPRRRARGVREYRAWILA